MSLQTARADIAKLRRDQPRNPTTMAVCDIAEELLNEKVATRAAGAPAVQPTAGSECPTCVARRATKAAAMRRYRNRKESKT